MFVWEDSALNEEQKAAIHEPSNLFLEACPGSGKTRTLTYKIALELSKLNDPKKWIIAITYTHRAADEIRERIENLGVNISQLWTGTIHAFCVEWILKPYGLYHNKLKYGFRIIDAYDSEKKISQLCTELGKNERITSYDCNHYYTSCGLKITGSHTKIALATSILKAYHRQLEENNQIDFETILYYSYEIVSNHIIISEILGKLFAYILIDEYQDTKEIQYAILSSIIKTNKLSLKTFITGDANQAIYGSLGGYAIKKDELEDLTEVTFKSMTLQKNYRSSSKIINYFRNFSVLNNAIEASGKLREHKSLITYNTSTDKDDLVESISQYIEHNLYNLDIPENEICIIAPWWIHLAALTRKLVTRLPKCNFDGPGLVPFSIDLENFWFKLAQIILTEPSPTLYIRRLRWASDILADLALAQVSVTSMTEKRLLLQINSIVIEETQGLLYLRLFFEKLFSVLKIDFTQYPMLKEHHDAFFSSSAARVERLKSENEYFNDDVETFRKAFKPKTGIKVSTIHGVKGAEYDVVISFGLLQGLVPNFNDPSEDSAKRLLYVLASRAKKNLHLISERGRMRGSWSKQEYQPTNVLSSASTYHYDQLSI